MAEFNIKKLRSGGLITNYFCTSSCKHCLYNCSPQWEKRYIDSKTAEKSLMKIRSLGCRSVHIGGGEPLLRPDKLGTVLEVASKIGVSVEYVETNSSWFRDVESSKALLARLRRKGLQTLLVSISPFHIDLFGNYIPGLCSGLAVWKDDLGIPLSAEKYPILVNLYLNGIGGLFEFAQENYGLSPQKTNYINKCDLCTEIRTHLKKNEYDESNELNPVEFYTRNRNTYSGKGTVTAASLSSLKRR